MISETGTGQWAEHDMDVEGRISRALRFWVYHESMMTRLFFWNGTVASCMKRRRLNSSIGAQRGLPPRVISILSAVSPLQALGTSVCADQQPRMLLHVARDAPGT